MKSVEELERQMYYSLLAYLNMEECAAKLERLHLLEDWVTEFLSITPHSHKFRCPPISSAFASTIVSDGDVCTASKASAAFKAIEKYATNLLTNPWRKEYKTLKLYSGFFQHMIKNQLVNAPPIFHYMGYKPNHGDKSSLAIAEPIDPDKFAWVALDCTVAHVECQIMIQISEKLQGAASWAEIVKVRRNHICNVDDAVKILTAGDQYISLPHRRSSLDKITSSKPLKNELLIDVFDTNDRNEDFIYLPPPSQFTNSPISSSFNKKSNGSNKLMQFHDNHKTFPTSSSTWLVTADDHHRNNFRSDDSYGNLKTSSRVDPAWIPPPHAVDKYSPPSYAPSGKFSTYCLPSSSTHIDGMIIPPPPPPVGSQYHYCHHHDNIPPPPPPPAASMYGYLCDNFQNMNLSSPGHAKSSSCKRDSFYDNVMPSEVDGLPSPSSNSKLLSHADISSSVKHKKKDHNGFIASSPLLKGEKEGMPSHVSNGTDARKNKQHLVLANADTKKWACTFCTFLNKGDKTACDVCGLGRETTPLVMGRECPQCTLINHKTDTVCTACNASLKDSPTYI